MKSHFQLPFFCTIALLGHSHWADLVGASQRICGSIIPEGPFQIWQSALICGISPGSFYLSPLHTLGLSHLIVVSGAHLIFVAGLFRFLTSSFKIPHKYEVEVLILCIYSVFAGFQPPVVRALFQRSVFGLNGLNIFLSGILAWLFFRELSLSLTLSWTCALLTSWPTIKPMNAFVKSALIHLGLSPLLLGIGNPSIWSVLINPIAIFLFGIWLFPLTLLNVILPLSTLTDFSWSAFLSLSFWLGEVVSGTPSQLLALSVVVYIFMIQSLHLFLEVKKNRRELWGK